jgi:Disulphide bond corrector protein DsbC
MPRRWLPGLAVAAALLVSGCAGPGTGQPSAGPSGRLSGSGVTVVAVLATGPDGTGYLRVTFSPQRPGYHLYSVHLPPGGVNGLGVPTVVSVRDGLRITGSPTADVPVRNLRIEELDVDLPVYPNGPVTVSVPVRRIGNRQPEVLVTYGACSANTCLPPARNRLIVLA